MVRVASDVNRTPGTCEDRAMTPIPMVVYVDVDDTLVRSFGSKRIPMTEMVAHVRALARQGAVLHCWSTGGSDYARSAAAELGIEGCFASFLPKPNVIIDDQPLADWRRTVVVHPAEAASRTLEDYVAALPR
jgi:hypothetical protein